jgi:hypothetical protein
LFVDTNPPLVRFSHRRDLSSGVSLQVPQRWFYHPSNASQETAGAFAFFGPGQFSTFYPDITVPAAHGNFHFAGEVASKHHAWVSGALESAERCVDVIVRREKPPKEQSTFPDHFFFKSDKVAKFQYLRGLYQSKLEAAMQ